MASFLCLVPSTQTFGEETVNTYMQRFLGSDGIFVALVLSVCAAAFYGFLTRKNVPGLVGMLLCTILPVTVNPTIMMPWAMPSFASAFLSGGPSTCWWFLSA